MASIKTLGQAYSAGWTIQMRCIRGRHRGIVKIDECGWRSDLDMKTLVCTRGRAFPLSSLPSRLVCPNCGDRGAELIYHVPGGNIPNFQPKSPWREDRADGSLAHWLEALPACACGAPATAAVSNDWGSCPYCEDCLPTEIPKGAQPAYPVPVCNLYSVTTNQKAIADLARAFRDITGNLPLLPGIFPDQLAPVVRTGSDGKRELLMMRWGMAPPPQAKVKQVTNVRNTSSAWWKRWLAKPESRCLVPVTAFCEYDHMTSPPTPTWFARDKKRSPFFFAGIWQPWKGTRGTKAHPVEGEHLLFAFLTTEPNAVVAPIHPKAMPVLLMDERSRDTWMNAPIEEALALQRPAAPAAVKIVATGRREDGVQASENSG